MVKSERFMIIFGYGLILVIISGLVLGFQYLHDRGINYPTGAIYERDVVNYYEISSTTILDDLNRGKTSVFTPADTSVSVTNTPYPPDSYPWHQSDYLMVANALNQLESKDSNGWEIYGMIFDRDCQNESIGFDFSQITYFKYDHQQNSYRIHQIGISPRFGLVSYLEKGGFQRPLFGWKSINLNLLFVSADAALQKSEEKGGKEFRSKLSNACDISLVTKPSTGGDNWRVSYLANNHLDDFDIYVNLYTGWYKVDDQNP
jgi:hypothetical protein